MSPEIAIITPSYEPDFEHCQILCESIQLYVEASVHHYIIIPKRDRHKFEKLQNERTSILFQDDLMPTWMYAIPGTNKWWFSLRSWPVRGWIRQQIVKLSAATACNAKFMLFVDSDCFFTQPFRTDRFINQDGRAPLFREKVPSNRRYQQWYSGAADILGIEEPIDSLVNYVGPFIFWSRSDLIALLTHIETIHKKSWQQVICQNLKFSEYTVYGVFIDYIRKDNSQHYTDHIVRSLNYWPEEPADQATLQNLLEKGSQQHIGAMISAKSNTSIKLIREVFLHDKSQDDNLRQSRESTA